MDKSNKGNLTFYKMSLLRKVLMSILNGCTPKPPTRLREASAEQGRGSY